MATMDDISFEKHNNMYVRDPHNNNNRNDNEPSGRDGDLLRQFTQWDNYLSNSHAYNTPESTPQLTQRQGQTVFIEQHRDKPQFSKYQRIRKFPSIRSKDFTSWKEIHDNDVSKCKQHGGKNKRLDFLSRFIFHRGFLKRSNIKKFRSKLLLLNKRGGPKFRNKNEFNSYLNYIDLVSLINDEYRDQVESRDNPSLNDINTIVFPYKKRYLSDRSQGANSSIVPTNITFYKPSNNNQIVVNKILPMEVYLNHKFSNTFIQEQVNKMLDSPKFHNLTIHRKLSKRKQTLNTMKNTHITKGPKRSKTLPNNYQYDTTIFNRRNDDDDEENIRETWSQYLQAVITQRIKLRLSLLKSQPTPSIGSSTNSHRIHSIPTQEKIKNC